MNEFLATAPFDLYGLSVFHLVAKHRSFTEAGRKLGLTQSAVSRQIQGIESRLEVTLFERTTRQVLLTPAGQLLYDRAGSILQATENTLAEVQHQFGILARTLRVGAARSIGLAYYPGFFFSFGRLHPQVQLQVTQESSGEILASLQEGRLDAGLLPVPSRLPKGLEATHRFQDDFTIISAANSRIASALMRPNSKRFRAQFKSERWLILDRHEETGDQLHRWLQANDLAGEPAMELDSFDVIVNLVALGMGISAVPQRILALYGNRKKVTRIAIRPRFTRELAVVIRKSVKPPQHLCDFIDCVLF